MVGRRSRANHGITQPNLCHSGTWRAAHAGGLGPSAQEWPQL